jgi:hypothetical protein
MSSFVSPPHLPLDILYCIANHKIKTYERLLALRRFALSTLSPSRQRYYQSHFITLTKRTYRKKDAQQVHCLSFNYFWHFNHRTLAAGECPNTLILHRPDGPAHIEWVQYKSDDNLYKIREAWYNKGRLYRDDLPSEQIPPSVIEYYVNGLYSCKEWYVHGLLHRDVLVPSLEGHGKTGPAVIKQSPHGKVSCETWYVNGRIHRDGAPAYIDYYFYITENGHPDIRSIGWYNNGQLHREDGPACVAYAAGTGRIVTEKWCINGYLHRNAGPDGETGPSVISYNATGRVSCEEWYVEGKLHRNTLPNGNTPPSLILYHTNGTVNRKKWYYNNIPHRDDGPAFIDYAWNGIIQDEAWYHYGQLITNGPNSNNI